MGGVRDGNVGGDRVRRVFLLDVCEDRHALGVDRFAIPQQRARLGLGEKPLVGDVGVDEVLAPDERPTDRVRDRERVPVAPREDLDAQRHVASGGDR